MGNTTNKEDIHAKYSIGRALGKGTFAVVKIATRKSDEKQFAVKVIRKDRLDQEELSKIHDEVDIMQKIDHPHCVRLYEIFETKKKLYMVLELLTGGELFNRIIQQKSYSEQSAAVLVRDVASALKYLHSLGVVHRDLKPENLLYASPLPDSPIKITDFGLSKLKAIDQEYLSTACGTPGYVAPEVLEQKGYGPQCDLWSLGVILYILLCGFPPFYHERTTILYKQIKAGKFSFPAPYWSNISDSAKELVRMLLTVNPNLRATPDEVLKHPWIQGAAPAAELPPEFSANLKLLSARAKLRKGVNAILAVNKFIKAVELPEQEQ